MKPKLPQVLILPAALLWNGCSGTGTTESLPPVAAPEGPSQAQEPAAIPEPPAPPKPSLSRLTDRSRPHLDFFGATIYADSISGLEASGNVYLDGTNLHRQHRSFPMAVYADRVRVDPAKGEVVLSGWPIVRTDSAFVQAQSSDTVILLSQSRMSEINGPARYVIGDKGADLFGP